MPGQKAGIAPDFGGSMKSRKPKAEIAVTSCSRQRGDAQSEIRNFLQALSSYPKRFADDPCLSFEQYLISVSSADLAGVSNRQN